MYNGFDNYLPAWDNFADAITDGRNIKHGYQRGWGIEYGGLVEIVRKDPDYAETIELARGRTIVAEKKLMNLFLIMKFFIRDVIKDQSAAIIEFGSYKGGCSIFLAALAKRLKLPITVYGLDTFVGMPQTDNSIDAHREKDFSDIDLEVLNDYKKSVGLDNLEFVKGLFCDTAPSLLLHTKKVCLAHVDCDIYESVAYAYDIVKPHMMQGGYIAFDDSTTSSYLGATAAVENLLIRRDGMNCEQIYPHFVFRALGTQE